MPLPPTIAARLARHLDGIPADPESLLFTSAQGTPLRLSNFRRDVWHPTLRQLGLPMMGVHALRHSAAARMIGAGATPKAVQAILGHGSAAFTLTVYGHLFDTDMDALAAAMDAPPTGRERDAGGTLGRIRGQATP